MNCKILMLSMLFFCAWTLPAVTLVSNGKPKAAVILPDEPFSVQKLAAEELIYHIKRATGATLPLYSESKAPKMDNYVYIGPCRRTAASGIDHKKLSPAEFKIVSQKNELFICGSDTKGSVGSTFAPTWHGTLWGVYDLLRNELGIRWIWPGKLGEYIPERKDIVFKDSMRSRKPALRHTSFQGLKYKPYLKKFMFKNSLSFLEAQKRFVLRNRLGAIEHMRAGHNFNQYWKMYGKTNPEFFAFVPHNGRKPLKGDSTGRVIDLCLSSPALHRRIVKNHFARKKAGSGENRIILTLNDTPILCQCARCRSWDAKDPAFESSSYWTGKQSITTSERFIIAATSWGENAKINTEVQPSLSDRFCRFVNEVVKLARQRDPNIKAIGFAYSNYTNPPVNEKISNMLLVYVGSHWFPYTDAMSKKFREHILAWKNAGIEEVVFRPNLTHAGANLPVFYAREFAADFKFAAQNGMVGASLDALLGAYAVQGPTLYTIIRLMDDPAASVESILDEYYSCFGPVKNEVRNYFEFWERHSNKLKNYDMKKICREETFNGRRGGTFKNYVTIAHRLFSLKDFEDAAKLLDLAWQKSGSDPQARKRVEYLQKGLHEAELTVKARLAQVKSIKEPGAENKRSFEKAVHELNQYRVKIDSDFTSNHAYFLMREAHGSKWPVPKAK